MPTLPYCPQAQFNCCLSQPKSPFAIFYCRNRCLFSQIAALYKYLQTACPVTFWRACSCWLERTKQKHVAPLLNNSLPIAFSSVTPIILSSLLNEFTSQYACYSERHVYITTEAAWQHCLWGRFTTQCCWLTNGDDLRLTFFIGVWNSQSVFSVV